jgi:hypothetical protein
MLYVGARIMGTSNEARFQAARAAGRAVSDMHAERKPREMVVPEGLLGRLTGPGPAG